MKFLTKIKKILTEHKKELEERFKVKEIGIWLLCQRQTEKDILDSICDMESFTKGMSFEQFSKMKYPHLNHLFRVY